MYWYVLPTFILKFFTTFYKMSIYGYHIESWMNTGIHKTAATNGIFIQLSNIGLKNLIFESIK